jgi:putative ATPase
MKPIDTNNDDSSGPKFQPLASCMRPKSLETFIGQTHLLGPSKPLTIAILQGVIHSMILWGPPGSGKTTLAFLISKYAHARFVRLSAISAGVKDIRETVSDAKEARNKNDQATILFIDEIHRFNKNQQDVLLPYIEDGTFILIGATTENPSFELNSALLSRARVYVLKQLTHDELLEILQAALKDKKHGLGNFALDFPLALQHILVEAASGDARQVLNLLEIIADFAQGQGEKLIVTEKLLAEVIQVNLRRFDKGGDAFYDQISALHKSIRGSSPDAALYWLCRMLDGGCDPLYIGRRLIRMACEDIGIADPRALQLAVNANEVYERLGTPEGELALAEAVIYLSCAPKSNAVYVAFNDAMQDVKREGSLEVPLHLRNAPTSLMKGLGYGKAYRYAHDESDAYAAGENYFPENFSPRTYYHPKERGLEIKIKEHLKYLRELDKKQK